MAFPPRTWFLGQLVTAPDMNAEVRDNINTLAGGGVVPVGYIADWGDLISTIPSGWADCDGGGGRPNLHDRIAVGAGNLYAVGVTGGALTSTPSGHTAHVLTQGPHLSHVVGAGTDHPDATGHSDPGGTTYGLNSAPQHLNQALSAHDGFANHNAIIDSGGPDVHLHAAMATLPPYHARGKMQKASSGLSLTTPRTWVSTEVNTAAQLNAELRDNPNFLIANLLATKTILIWGGSSLVNLPAGWQLCDGTNGTPDLRDKFIIAAGNSYAVAATGGALTTSLAAHSAHVLTQPTGHANHTVTQAASHASAALATVAGGVSYMATVTHSGFNVDPHSAHSGFNLSAHYAHQFGGISTTLVLPPYIALAYIMLTSVPSVTTPKTWTTSEVVQQSEFNTYIRDNENGIAGAQVPIGTIGYWSGSAGSIPANYHDCDGSIGGLLNLHDLFILGAGNSYAIWAQGGASAATPDAHTAHTVTQPGSHSNHTVTQPGAHSVQQQANGLATNYDFLFNSSFTHNFTVDPHSDHAFSVDPHSAHVAASILPPYYALYMIQRIS